MDFHEKLKWIGSVILLSTIFSQTNSLHKKCAYRCKLPNKKYFFNVVISTNAMSKNGKSFLELSKNDYSILDEMIK